MMQWRSGIELVSLDSSTLSKGGEGRPRLARDEEYASAVLRVWRKDITARNKREHNDNDDGSSGSSTSVPSVSSPFIYSCPAEGTSLHGHIYRRSSPSSSTSRNNSDDDNSSSVPGIVLFHTGAGPQDIFLRWKADTLVNESDIGWPWGEGQVQYNKLRRRLVIPNETDGTRELLAGRVRASIDALTSQPGVDPSRIGALGYCFGGQPLLELAKMRMTGIRVLATFHCMFDGLRDYPIECGSIISRENNNNSSNDENDDDCHVIICTGGDDPFVPAQDVEAATQVFQNLGYQTRVMKFEGTRHGFSNPGHDSNPNKVAFAYNEVADSESWAATLLLLKDMTSRRR
jgi:dienelactone hydrolase